MKNFCLHDYKLSTKYFRQVRISNRIILPFVTDDGCHVRLIGAKSLPHCPCTHLNDK